MYQIGLLTRQQDGRHGYQKAGLVIFQTGGKML